MVSLVVHQLHGVEYREELYALQSKLAITREEMSEEGKSKWSVRERGLHTVKSRSNTIIFGLLPLKDINVIASSCQED